MITQDQINELNSLFKEAKPSEIIKKAFEISNQAVVTTNFRPYEAAILFAVNS
ncbi:MAG: phosphoadenylylsulfate reductase, partial [Flavobacteriaceae bacterium CG_4_10_14_3_um_filter_33_47]